MTLDIGNIQAKKRRGRIPLDPKDVKVPVRVFASVWVWEAVNRIAKEQDTKFHHFMESLMMREVNRHKKGRFFGSKP